MYLCGEANLFYRSSATAVGRKVRTTQSTPLPNGKGRAARRDTESATENIPSRQRRDKGENVG